MKTERLTIFFELEGWPKIGTGMRRCDVSVGRKWVHVMEPASGGKRSFSKPTFAALMARRRNAVASVR